MLCRGGILVVELAGPDGIRREHGLERKEKFVVHGGIAAGLLDIRGVQFEFVPFFLDEIFCLAVKSRKVVADDFVFFGDERRVHRIGVELRPFAHQACDEPCIVITAFVNAGVADASLDPGISAIGVVLAHVGDGRVVGNVERVRFFLEAFAIDGEGGIGHALFVVDGSHQAVEVFVDVSRIEFCCGLGVRERLVHLVLGVVRECHLVFDECVFGCLLFGLLVLGDGFVVLTLFVELYAFVD